MRISSFCWIFLNPIFIPLFHFISLSAAIPLQRFLGYLWPHYFLLAHLSLLKAKYDTSLVSRAYIASPHPPGATTTGLFLFFCKAFLHSVFSCTSPGRLRFSALPTLLRWKAFTDWQSHHHRLPLVFPHPSSSL